VSALETTGENAKNLTISIATWNNRELLAGCLRSIEPQVAAIGAEVFVVDNASTDGTAKMVRAEFPWVKLIRNQEPMGFSANNNEVIRRSTGRFVLLLNDDTVILGDALVRLFRFMENHPEAGAAGCTLVSPNGVPERISQRFPHPLDPIFPRLRCKVDPAAERRIKADAVEVDRLSGACLMVRRDLLDRIGLLDERFDPAYGEDTDLCWRIKKAGRRIYRLPAARVVHYRGRTAKREFPDQARRLQEAKFRWYEKNRSRPALWLYRFSVILASLIRLAACLPLFFSERRRDEARARSRRLLGRLQAAFGPARG